MVRDRDRDGGGTGESPLVLEEREDGLENEGGSNISMTLAAKASKSSLIWTWRRLSL